MSAYNQFFIILMQVFLLLSFLVSIVLGQTPSVQSQSIRIKAGLSVVHLLDKDEGSITVNYNNPMPDNTYLRLASLAYIANYVPQNGLRFETDCNQVESTTQLHCGVKAFSNSSQNIIYMTYLVSDQADFVVGSFLTTLSLTGTSLTTTIAHILNIDQTSSLRKARQAVNFLPFISGIYSLDQDFELKFQLQQSFNTLTAQLTFQISIKELHTKNISMIFGFAIFLPQKYTINLFNDYMFEPNNNAVNKYVIFYIKQISNKTGLGSSSNGGRRLQTQSVSPTIRQRNITIVPSLTINNGNSTNNGSASGNQTSSDSQSAFQKEIYSEGFSLRKVNVTTITRTVNTRISSFAASFNTPLVPETRSQSDSQAGQFQDLFATNGFSIILNESVADPIIFLELNPYVDVGGASATSQPGRMYIFGLTPTEQKTAPTPAPVEITININTKHPAPFSCASGFLVLELTKIDLIQYTYRYKCIYCRWGEYFNYARRKCFSFPIIDQMINVVDLVE